jgi:hypothetical protein
MPSPSILYTFEFTDIYDETIFSACPFATDTLRTKVQNAVTVQQTFLKRFPKVNKIAQQVYDNGEYFKVVLANSQFNL